MTIADQRGDPVTLVDLAVAARREAEREDRRGRGAAWDEIWCVFDGDGHPNLGEAFAKAAANHINLAVSSPCIELWFILHFEDQTRHIERRSAESRARKLLRCDKVLTGEALDQLAERYSDARMRAIALDEKHAGAGLPGRTNPSSEVWKLVDQIRAEAGGVPKRLPAQLR